MGGAQLRESFPGPDVLPAHPGSGQAPHLPLMLVTHHSKVLPVPEEQVLVTTVVPSVLLPWSFHCSHTTPGCSIAPILATSCRLRNPGTSATPCC